MPRRPFFLLIFLIFNHCIHAQKQGKDYFRVMFYNVENYFDTVNDPTTNDNEFTPEGSMRWTVSRYKDKRDNIFRVIAHVGEWDPPAIVGLCEIENRGVLDDLIRNTPLMKYPYRIVHKDSPDQRGIDVALLYRDDYLKCIAQQFIRVRFPDNRKRTRDILYATLRTLNDDTLHVFVCHSPSRVGGQRQSEPGRLLVASLVRNKVDSIFNHNPMARIIITGDMNDGPLDKSLHSELRALTDTAQAKPSALFNLSAYKMKESTGTIKYQGKWSVFDQIIVSGGLLRGPLRTNVSRCYIFRADYLFEPDNRYQGVIPFRTYIGQKYNNGFSDHLPVYVDIIVRENK
jgi:endonuclease/exonuclease/phosphatase family metal-dependent hydrolase